MYRPTQLFIFSTLAALALADLRCYDCDPTSTNGCLDPEANLIKSVPCEQQIYSPQASAIEQQGLRKIFTSTSVKSSTSDWKYDCIVANYIHNGQDPTNPEGVYRGCIRRTTEETLTPCQVMMSKLSKGNITSCISCDSDNCNKMAPGSAATIALAAILLPVAIATIFF